MIHEVPSSIQKESIQKSPFRRIWTYIKYPDISVFYFHLSAFPLTNLVVIRSFAKGASKTERRVKVELVSHVFKGRGKRWIEETGKSGYLDELRHKDRISGLEEDAQLKRAVDVLATPPSEELKGLEINTGASFLILGEGGLKSRLDLLKETWKNAPEEKQFFPVLSDAIKSLSPAVQEELMVRGESAGIVLREFLDPERRERPLSYFWRTHVIKIIGRTIYGARYASELPLLTRERKLMVFLLTHTSSTELDPDVLESIVSTLSQWVDVWIQHILKHREEKSHDWITGLETAIKAEIMTGHRVDAPLLKKEKVDNISYLEALLMAKSLVAICFRIQPEARKMALKEVAGLIEVMDKLKPKLRNASFGVSNEKVLKQCDDIRKILGLPERLPKNMVSPLGEYLPRYNCSVNVETGINGERVVLVSLDEGGNSKKTLEKIFAWASLHFPESDNIVLRILPNQSEKREKQLSPFRDIKKSTEQAYEENLYSLAV